MEALRDATGETVHLAVFNKGEMLYIDKVESRERVRMACVVGSSVPLHTTAGGKAYVSALSDELREDLVRTMTFTRVTDRSITSRSAFLEQIERARADGYAIDDQENERDIVCFGAPIRDRTGAPLAAISVSVPVFRLREDRQDAYVAPLLEATRRVSTLMGFRQTGGPAE